MAVSTYEREGGLRSPLTVAMTVLGLDVSAGGITR